MGTRLSRMAKVQREAAYIWEDREIHFDLASKLVQPRKGEFIVDRLAEIEDCRGNSGVRGVLLVTNLRMLWYTRKSKRVNLSVGYKTIISMTIRSAASRLKGGATQALYVLAKAGVIRYEFVFAFMVPNSPRLFTTIQAVHRAYESSKLYRELKLRAAVVRDKQLLMLPQETLYSKVNGVWNLSSDQGNLGRFFITNVRVVWHAQLAENFSVSIPYMQMKSVRLRDSAKFGVALVIESSEESGAFVLGFRIDPLDALKEVVREIENLFALFAETPVFGVDYVLDEVPQALEARKVERIEEDVEFDEHEAARPAVAVYLADAGKNADRPAIFSPELGLAIEDLREGTTLAQLWNVVT
eukprot:c17796_g1_i1.p1 GENE.c17796_g1_i1~~c17796_g1_i1.p1  ORF type:complete len:356 (-),score=73.26 c17796_g1_i1:549-1616(-)